MQPYGVNATAQTTVTTPLGANLHTLCSTHSTPRVLPARLGQRPVSTACPPAASPRQPRLQSARRSKVGSGAAARRVPLPPVGPVAVERVVGVVRVAALRPAAAAAAAARAAARAKLAAAARQGTGGGAVPRAAAAASAARVHRGFGLRAPCQPARI